MKKAKDWKSTSFHGVRFSTTPNKLIKLAKKLGADYCDSNNGLDKTNFDFEFETDNGNFFTVYDWKHYRKLKLNTAYDFHIGAENEKISNDAYKELQIALR